jgi:hypothetical protein
VSDGLLPSVQLFSDRPLPPTHREWKVLVNLLAPQLPDATEKDKQAAYDFMESLGIILFRASWHDSNLGTFRALPEESLSREIRMNMTEKSKVANLTGTLCFEAPGVVFYKSQAVVDRHPASGGFRIATVKPRNSTEVLKSTQRAETKGDLFHWVHFNHPVSIKAISAQAVTRFME